MYAWIWARLPGPTAAKALISLVLLAAVVLALFTVVFPWAVTWLPGQDVSVDTG
jgi:hypothetical protein